MNVKAEGKIKMPDMPNLEIHGTGRIISTFALQHLMAAALFARHAQIIERQNLEMPFGAFFEDIRSYVSGAIMSSTAALEANINELFIAHGGPLRSTLHDFDTDFWGRKGIEQKSILAKYQEALRILGKEKLREDSPFYEDAEDLIGLRNCLVHFKPLWDPEKKRQVDLVGKLKNKFALSSFCDEGADFIAMKCMSYSCAAWAVLVSKAFVKEFSMISGLQDRFSQFQDKLHVE